MVYRLSVVLKLGWGLSVGRGSWFVGPKSWVVGPKSWVVGSKSWVIDWKGSTLARRQFFGIPSISKQTLSSLQQQTIFCFNCIRCDENATFKVGLSESHSPKRGID